MTQTIVTFSEDALRTLANDPILTPERARACPAGVNRLPGRLEWLVHRASADEPRPAGDAPRVIVVPENRPALLLRRLDDAPFFAPPDVPAAVVVLGIGPAAGTLAGVCRVGKELRPLDRIRLSAAGLPDIDLAGRTLSTEPEADSPWPEEELLSRTIGALGAEQWQRLRRLHVGLVGCGRTGSLLATGLRKLGVRRLTLLDPDCIEPHNFGEMDAISLADVGRPKAEAVADGVADLFAPSDSTRPPLSALGLTPVADSVLSLPGLAALKPADLLICCADSAAARLASTLLAAFYLKPLLDIGTGILTGPGVDNRRLGADIRLATGGCLLCLGGVVDLSSARRELLHGRETDEPDWRRERLGSLRSLNTTAVGLGLRLLEDFVSGRRTSSAWLHLETDPTGLPALESRSPGSTTCPVCAHAGTGDVGVNRIREVLEVL